MNNKGVPLGYRTQLIGASNQGLTVNTKGTYSCITLLNVSISVSGTNNPCE